MASGWIGTKTVTPGWLMSLSGPLLVYGFVEGLAGCNHLGYVPGTYNEMAVPRILLLLAGYVSLIIAHLRFQPSLHAWGAFLLTLAMFWMGDGLGWAVDHRKIRPDVIFIPLILWIISGIVGGIVIAIVRPGRRPLPGPYCRGCGYCVVGLSEARCPECGRPFTAAELGVSEDELRAEPSANTDERER